MIDAVIVVEDEARAWRRLWLRRRELRVRRGCRSRLFATGSPRKRFDRAVKKGAREIVVLGFADGAVTRRIKSNDQPRAEALLAGL